MRHTGYVRAVHFEMYDIYELFNVLDNAWKRYCNKCKNRCFGSLTLEICLETIFQ